MLVDLKKLIFGLDEYEKVKIESRIKDATQLISNIKVYNKEDFEVIEDVISKLKECLRIRSSNLNCVIRSSSRNLSRNEVDNLIEQLNKIKYEYLEIAERKINKQTQSQPTPEESQDKTTPIEYEETFEEELPSQEPIEQEEPEETPKEEEPIKPIEEKEEFKDISEVEREIKTKKKEEDSLDALLEGVQEKKKEIHTPIPNNEETKTIPQNKEEPIVEHKKSEATIEKVPVEIVRENERKYAIYQDNNIIAYLKSDSKVPGEVLIESRLNKKLIELNEEELSYIVAFSKLFAGVLFEALEAHGTNIYWNYKENQIHILPRYQNDNLNIDWTPTTVSEKSLEDVKEKLLDAMLKELPSKEPQTNQSEIESNPEQKPHKKEEEIQTPIKAEQNEDLDLKAKEIIDAINKIP